MDITVIINGLIGVAVFLFTWKLWPLIKAAIPASTMYILNLVAKTAVYAAEAHFGPGYGEQKLAEAISTVDVFLNKYGFDIDSDKVNAAIHAAWGEMNTKQIAAGEKDPPTDDFVGGV